MSFEWRANKGPTKQGFDPEQGGLFACRPQLKHDSSSLPTLTWVPPMDPKDDKSSDSSNDDVNPSPGDDLSPPNAIQANRINGIALPISASAGWSASPPQQQGIYPTNVDYQVRLLTSNSSNSTNDDALQVTAVWEYSNPRFAQGESMMIKVAIAKTVVQEELGTTLDLVATRFAEFIPQENRWINITADVDYTTTAQAVVDAVLQDQHANQTAGMATVKAETIELTLGPFSAKARLEVTFQAQGLYSYDAMSVKADASDIGTQRLLPLFINLPFAPVDQDSGLSKVAVALQAPAGTTCLPMDTNRLAYRHLQTQDVMKSTTILAVTDLMPDPAAKITNSSSTTGFCFNFESLPPRSCGILAWLVLPTVQENDAGFDFVQIAQSLETISDDSQKGQVTIQQPATQDLPNLQVPLPGFSPMGSLWRLKIKTPKAKPRTKPCLIVNLTLSDKSGSTARRVDSNNAGEAVNMRQRFNQLAETRFLKRLESIPALVEAGVARMDDVCMDVFLPFDSRAPPESIQRVTYRVADVHDLVDQFLQGIRSDTANAATAKLSHLTNHVQALRGVAPGGLTDFSVGPRTLASQYHEWLNQAKELLGAKVEVRTFCEFDTDGGHNGSSTYLDELRNLCDIFSVRSGVVTGFGSWLNQDCASKVARVLGSVPALLSLQVPAPGSEGLDKVFRRGFSAWVFALRQPPNLKLKISAGFVEFATPSSGRMANAVDVLALRCFEENQRQKTKFGAPDIKNENFTKAVIEGVPAGKELVVYVVSRLPNAPDLARHLEILSCTDDGESEASKANVWTESETISGNFLAYDWLRVLTNDSTRKDLCSAPVLATSLAARLEDEVSFRFNLASPSGKTSYLGRSKTTARAPIDSAHQPESPQAPLPSPRDDLQRRQKARKEQSCFLSSNSFQAYGMAGCVAGPPGQSQAYSGIAYRRGGRGGGGMSISEERGVQSSCRAAFSQPHAAALGAPAPMDLSMQLATASPQCGSFGGAALGVAKQPNRRSATGFERKRCKQKLKSGSREADRPSTNPSISRWMDALDIPSGSTVPLLSKYHDYFSALKHGLTEIAHCKQRLARDPNVAFVCDVCQRSLGRDESRYHCYHCQDYDSCNSCRFREHLPFHDVRLISPQNNTNTMTEDEKEDPLVSSLLEPKNASITTSASTATLPTMDRTEVWCRDRLRRFVAAIFHWWPVFRMTCPYGQRLPPTLNEDLAQKLCECLIVRSGWSPEADASLMESVGVLLETLAREETAHQRI